MSLDKASIVRSSKDPKVASRLTVSVSTTGFQVKKGSNMNMHIPTNQMTWEGKAGITCRKTSDNSEIAPCYVYNFNNALNVTFTEFCSSNGNDCALDASLNFYIDGLVNPSYQPSKRSDNAVKVRVLEGYKYVYGETADIFPTPNIETAVFLTELSITRDNSVAGDASNIICKFKIPSDLASTTKLYIQMPPFSFYSVKDQSCYDG